MGATAVELDIQFAGDSTPVVYHDRSLERMAGVKGAIRDQTVRELSGYDIGFRFGDRYRGLRVLTLEDALALVPPGVEIHLDIKDYAVVNAKHLRGLVAVLKGRGGLERCLVTSTDEAVLAALAGADSEVRRGLRTSGASSGAPDRAAALGCASLHPEASATKRDLVEACREKGLKVYPHSANDSRAMRALLDLGVDGISTDFPDRLVEAAGGRPARRRPESRGTSRRREPRPEPEKVESAPPPADKPAAKRTRRRRSGRGKEAATDRAADKKAGSAAEAEKAPAGKSAPSPATSTRSASPAAETAEPQPAAGEGEAAPRDAKRRRRGRRGGKREQARRARREARTPPSDAAEPIPLEPVEDLVEPLELLGDIDAEIEPNQKGEDAPQPSAEAKGDESARPKRRRGRRGGRKVQARRRRKMQEGNGSGS